MLLATASHAGELKRVDPADRRAVEAFGACVYVNKVVANVAANNKDKLLVSTLVHRAVIYNMKVMLILEKYAPAPREELAKVANAFQEKTPPPMNSGPAEEGRARFNKINDHRSSKCSFQGLDSGEISQLMKEYEPTYQSLKRKMTP